MADYGRATCTVIAVETQRAACTAIAVETQWAALSVFTSTTALGSGNSTTTTTAAHSITAESSDCTARYAYTDINGSDAPWSACARSAAAIGIRAAAADRILTITGRRS